MANLNYYQGVMHQIYGQIFHFYMKSRICKVSQPNGEFAPRALAPAMAPLWGQLYRTCVERARGSNEKIRKPRSEAAFPGFHG